MGIAFDNLPEELATLVGDEMDPGESVVWTGQPNPARYARRGIPCVIFGIFWTGVIVVFFLLFSSFRPPDMTLPINMLYLFFIPFALLGFGMLSAPFWMIRIARRTAYAITDRRIIIFQGKLFQGIKIRSFTSNGLNKFRRTQYADGSGDLIFHRELVGNHNGNANFIDHGFIAIPDVKAVEALVRNLNLGSGESGLQ